MTYLISRKETTAHKIVDTYAQAVAILEKVFNVPFKVTEAKDVWSLNRGQ